METENAKEEAHKGIKDTEYKSVTVSIYKTKGSKEPANAAKDHGIKNEPKQ